MNQPSNRFYGIHHHSVIIADLERSRHFYQDIMGLELDESRPEMSFDGLWFKVGEQAIHCLCLKNPDPVEGTIAGVAKVTTATVFGAMTTMAAFFPLILIDNDLAKIFAGFSFVVLR